MHPTIAKIQKGNFRKVPEIKTGYTVKVSQKIREGGKERIQNFQGLIIKVSHGTGVEKTFTVRKIVEGIGVEKIFPLHSPNVTGIHVIKKAKVRREKLYYMRERFGKSARLSEKHVTDDERAKENVKMEALYAEAVKADDKKKEAETAVTDVSAESAVSDEPVTEQAEKAETNTVISETAITEEDTKDIPQDNSDSTGKAEENSAGDKPEEQAEETAPGEEAENETKEKES